MVENADGALVWGDQFGLGVDSCNAAAARSR